MADRLELIVSPEKRSFPELLPIHSVMILLSKIGKIKIKGRVVLFECGERDIACHFASDPKINRYCSLVGEKLLSVPEERMNKFKEEIKKRGYVIR